MKKELIFFTKYTQKGPSSRYRSYHYKPYLEEDFNLQFYSLFNDDYIDNLYGNNGQNYFQLFKAYFFRILQVLKYLGTDKIIFIEYELLPYFPPILEYLLQKTKVKFILDYDDAIFHNYDLHTNFIIRSLYKSKIPYIAKKAKYIITGSPYLTNFFLKHNNNVEEIPTSIIYQKYTENYLKNEPTDNVAIGWIGSKSTSINIVFIKSALDAISVKYPNIEFKLMGFDPLYENEIQSKNVEFFRWSEIEELPFLESIDIGIMPLVDSPSNRGKCGFKLIQYMAMGKPTISSPFEAHFNINRGGNNMFANTIDEWLESFNNYMNNIEYYKHIGTKNKEIVKKYYSVESNINLYIQLFNKIQ